MPGTNAAIVRQTPSRSTAITRRHSLSLVRSVFAVRMLITAAAQIRTSTAASGPNRR